MGCRFDNTTERYGLNSIKWDKAREIYGCDNLIPMWVADMDFQPPESVIQAVVQRAQNGFYGYESSPAGYVDTFQSWLSTRHDWTIPREWITHSPGVVSGLSFAVRAFTQPGDKIVIQTPVYHPFFSIIKRNKRELLENPLIIKDGRYTMDFADLEQKFASGAKAMILCSPHNPVGRVWSREELTELANLADRYGILILADEIWSDLVLPGNKHIPVATIDSGIAERSVTFMAPSKTFNVAGFYLSNVIIPNEELRKQYRSSVEDLALSALNSFGVCGAEAAYREGAVWLDELREYLKGNVEYTLNRIAEQIPSIKVLPPEGTYLLWLDCREIPLPAEELNSFFAQKAGVAFTDGRSFGGVGFQRMNIACPRSTITRALDQIENALASL